MLPASHLISRNLPGHESSDVRCPRAFTGAPCSSCNKNIRFSQGKFVPLGMSFICNANSSGQRRNPDFSKQNRNGFSRNKNRHNEDRDNTDTFDDPETFSSKNGPPFLSGSTSPKFQATSTPGPREREIVEIFRKVQARLREKAALKEEKKVDDSHVHNKQNETVDSLLKLLRKHSIQHGKSSNGSSRSNNNSNNRDFILDQPEQNHSYIEDRNPKDSKNNEVQSFRPVSNFQRRSPVPRLKYKPIFSGERKESVHEAEAEPEPEPKLEIESEPELENEAFPGFDESSDDEISDIEDSEEGNVTESSDLSGMKLTELRAVAKARGMKGVSKLKKLELLELLSR